MKKMIKLLVAVISVASLVACSKKEEAKVEPTPAVETTETKETATTEKTEETATTEMAMYKDGEYTGTAKGNNGDVEVSVKITEGKIESVTVIKHEETEGLADSALEQVPMSIVEKQSTEVDTVTGATYTSKAIIEAVNTALEAAK